MAEGFSAEAEHSGKEMAEIVCDIGCSGDSSEGKKELQGQESRILDFYCRVEIIHSIQWGLCLNGF